MTLTEAGSRTPGVVPPALEVVRPQLLLLDARELGLGTASLYERARALGDTSEGRYVSRAYRYPYALVASGPTPLGVALERIAPGDRAFSNLICTPDERAELDRAEDRDRHLTSLWSAKEALSKAFDETVAYEPARLGSPLRWRDGRAGCWRAESLPPPDGYVAWICWRAAADSGEAGEVSFAREVA